MVWSRASMLLAVVCAAIPVHADMAKAETDPAKPTVALNFAELGFRSVPTVTDTSCAVAMDLDEARFVAHIDDIKALRLLNENELPNRIDQMPETLAMAFTLQAAPSVTEKLYRADPRVDHCQFTQYMSVADADGIVRPLRVYSYGFSREQFAKTDWDIVTSERFIRSTSTLRFDHDFQKRLQKEAHPH